MDASYREPNSGAEPTSYAILSVPPKAVIRKKGYSPEEVCVIGSKPHPLATWTTYSLPVGSSYKDALLLMQQANKKPWGLLRARLHFSDGRIELFERRIPSSPSSFMNVGTYDPNEGKHAIVAKQAPRPPLTSLVNENGYMLSNKPRPSSFAPEVLYKNCPPPVHSQCGFDFTPVSYNSFLLKPSNKPKGCRNVQSNFEQRPIDFRPRAYLRDHPADSRHCHCAEVYQVGDYTQDLARQGMPEVIDGRNNYVFNQRTAKLGIPVQPSTIVGKRNARDPRFPCKGQAAGDSKVKHDREEFERHECGEGEADGELPSISASRTKQPLEAEPCA